VSGYSVTVSKATLHGRLKLHTFTHVSGFTHTSGLWVVTTPLSHKQRKQAHQAFTPAGTWTRPPLRRQLADKVSASPRLIDHKTVKLAADFAVPAMILTAVLDALRSDGRPEVDLGDIKRIDSQLSSDIMQLGSLDGETRRRAEAALYTEILRRCTTI
jgi:hypothetical protein